MDELILKYPVKTWVHHIPSGDISVVFIGYKGTIEPFCQIGDFDINNYESIPSPEEAQTEEEENE